MANKGGGRTRLKRWTTDVRRWNRDFQVGQSAIDALSRAAKQFGFDLRKEEDRRRLLFILADVVFGGKRGRPQGSKKWVSSRLLRLAEDRIEVEQEWPKKLSDRKAATEIKKRHPERYKDTSSEMMRQMLREARLYHWWRNEEALQAADDHARDEWEARGDSEEEDWDEDL
jgi:hypothetical protein